MSKRVKVADLSFVEYLKEEEILPEIERVAQEIERDLGDKDPLFVCILNGAFFFATDLAKYLDKPYEMTFAKYSSYKGLHSTGELQEIMAPQASVKGRVVVILEDLVDTGTTVTKLVHQYLEEGAKEVKIASMLSKPNAIKPGALRPDYYGLEIPNDFIVGRGLDYNGVGRMLRDIYVVDEE